MFIGVNLNTSSYLRQYANVFVENNTQTYDSGMTDLRKNLQNAMSEKGLNAYDMESLSGVPQPTTQRFLSGKQSDPRSATVQKWAKALGKTEAELRGLVMPILPGLKGDLSVEPGPEFKAVHYGSFRLQAGVVGFAVDMEDEDNAPLFFRADWLQSEGLKAENLTARKISGDSMSPGLQDGDTVLIDTSRIEPKDGKVFAVNYEGELVIKRMIRDAGQWWLASDNPDKTRYPHKLCAGDLCLIIGQCVHKQSTMI